MCVYRTKPSSIFKAAKQAMGVRERSPGVAAAPVRAGGRGVRGSEVPCPACQGMECRLANPGGTWCDTHAKPTPTSALACWGSDRDHHERGHCCRATDGTAAAPHPQHFMLFIIIRRTSPYARNSSHLGFFSPPFEWQLCIVTPN